MYMQLKNKQLETHVDFFNPWWLFLVTPRSFYRSNQNVLFIDDKEKFMF